MERAKCSTCIARPRLNSGRIRFAHFNPIVFGAVRSRTMAHSVQLVIAFAHHRRHRTDEYCCRNCKIEHQENPIYGRTKRGDSKILWLNYEFIDKWLSGILNRDLIHWVFVRLFPAVWFFTALNISGADEAIHERDYEHSGYGVGSHVWLNRCCSNGMADTVCDKRHTRRTQCERWKWFF